MSEIVPINGNGNELSAMTEEMLLDVRKDGSSKEKSMTMPIAQLSTLGAGVSSLIPAFNTVTQTLTFDTAGLYKVVNKEATDVFKVAKDGNYWGALKKAEGGSRFAKLAPADPLSATGTVAMNLNPAMIMMAVALFSIEKELGSIADMEKQILSFLEIEKEAEIEADVITLNDIIQKYKHNWDNERFIASNHKLVCDIKRTAQKNMLSSQKNVAETLSDKKIIVAQGQVNSKLSNLQKKFKYYRLSLYTFSLASLVEIMLSGNFKEENISSSIKSIRDNSEEYRSLFSDCSVFLEKMSNGAIEKHLLNGLGTASNAMGKLIGSIPKIKDGQVDEFLQEAGDKIKTNASEISKEVIESFAEVSNPNTGLFIQKMEDMIRIYNRTTEICVDKDNVYLIAG